MLTNGALNQMLEATGLGFLRQDWLGDPKIISVGAVIILHDWDDEQATTILRRCRAAAPATSRLVVVERVLPEHVGPADAEGVLADLNMMVLTGGRERTGAEFAQLLHDGGWHLERIVPTATGLGVVEAAPGGPG